MEYFVTPEPFLWIPPKTSPVRSVRWLHSFDSFVCIVKHWEQYAVRILKPCFLSCPFFVWGLRRLGGHTWGHKVTPDLFYLLAWACLRMMKPTCGWDPGAPGRRLSHVLKGFSFMYVESKRSSLQTAIHCFDSFKKLCLFSSSFSSFFVITLLSFPHSEKFERAASCHTE